MAAAALGDSEKVVFVPLFASARFPSLKVNQIDLLARNTSQTLGREANIGAHFAGVLYYDGQSFLVPADSRVEQVRDLDGASICVLKESTHVVHLADYFKAHGLVYQPVIVESITQARDEYFAARCQVYTSDAVKPADGSSGFMAAEADRTVAPRDEVVIMGAQKWFHNPV